MVFYKMEDTVTHILIGFINIYGLFCSKTQHPSETCAHTSVVYMQTFPLTSSGNSETRNVFSSW